MKTEKITAYELFNKEIREDVDLRDFEGIIVKEYKNINPRLKIATTPHFYLVIGEISRGEIYAVGKALSKHQEFSEYLILSGNCCRLFKSITSKRRKSDIHSMLNISGTDIRYNATW